MKELQHNPVDSVPQLAYYGMFTGMLLKWKTCGRLMPYLSQNTRRLVNLLCILNIKVAHSAFMTSLVHWGYVTTYFQRDNHGERGARSRFTNGFSITIYIRWKFCFTLTSILIQWSPQNFVDGTTSVLSWHVQNLLRSDDQQQIYSKAKFPSNLNCGQKAVCEKGPWSHSCNNNVWLLWNNIPTKIKCTLCTKRRYPAHW